MDNLVNAIFSVFFLLLTFYLLLTAPSLAAWVVSWLMYCFAALANVVTWSRVWYDFKEARKGK